MIEQLREPAYRVTCDGCGNASEVIGIPLSAVRLNANVAGSLLVSPVNINEDYCSADCAKERLAAIIGA